MRVTKEQALEIAMCAAELNGYGIENNTPYFIIWEDESDPENNFAVTINKECEEDGSDEHFAIYVSAPEDENFWEYTDTSSVTELAEELMRIAVSIEISEMERQGLSKFVD